MNFFFVKFDSLPSKKSGVFFPDETIVLRKEKRMSANSSSIQNSTGIVLFTKQKQGQTCLRIRVSTDHAMLAGDSNYGWSQRSIHFKCLRERERIL